MEMIFLGLVSLALFLVWIMFDDKGGAVMTTKLPDHDLKILLVTPTSTRWKHSYACPCCHSPVGHQEFMTKICLTCGQRMPYLPETMGFRHVTRHGRWVRNQSNGMLELRDGVWLATEEYDRSVASEKSEKRG